MFRGVEELMPPATTSLAATQCVTASSLFPFSSLPSKSVKECQAVFNEDEDIQQVSPSMAYLSPAFFLEDLVESSDEDDVKTQRTFNGFMKKSKSWKKKISKNNNNNNNNNDADDGHLVSLVEENEITDSNQWQGRKRTFSIESILATADLSAE